jgi:ATP citrate (pro-S)-lyase
MYTPTGKAGLIKLNADWETSKAWISERRNKDVQVEKVSGVLDTFLVEEFVPHAQEDEYYVCIHSQRNGDEILFHHEGGVDIGDVDAKAVKMMVDIEGCLAEAELMSKLLQKVLLKCIPFHSMYSISIRFDSILFSSIQFDLI